MRDGVPESRMRASIVGGGKYVGAGFRLRDVRAASGVDTDLLGQVYGREAAVSVLHHLPEALRL